MPNPRDGQAFDRYAYVLNNPLRYHDPSGHWIESAIDVISLGYDINDIYQNGLNWENGLSLVADLGSLALPAVAGGGALVRIAFHADELSDASRIVSFSGDAIAYGKKLIEGFPKQIHHLATDKFPTKWTLIFESYVNRYRNLNDLWNKTKIPHQGRHPEQYHRWIEDALKRIDAIAQGDQEKFQQLFEKYVTKVLEENLWLLKSDWWKQYGDEFWEWWMETVKKGLTS